GSATGARSRRGAGGGFCPPACRCRRSRTMTSWRWNWPNASFPLSGPEGERVRPKGRRNDPARRKKVVVSKCFQKGGVRGAADGTLLSARPPIAAAARHRGLGQRPGVGRHGGPLLGCACRAL